MSEHLILISADGHAGPPVAEFRPYIDAEHLDEFDRYVPAREAWRAERNRTMGLDEGDELVHALFGEDMVKLYTSQEAVESGGCSGVQDVRWIRDSGLASVMLPTGDFDLPSYHDPYYDPLWKACVETGLPVTFHSGGTPWEGYGPYAMWVTKMEFMWWCRRPLWQTIF